MFLTRMYLNGARRGTRSLLGSPQRMHAAVMSAFPPAVTAGSTSERVLWRVDRSPTTTLFVSSPARPDLTHVVEQAGWPSGSDHWQTLDLDPFLDRLQAGQQWVFRLTANPVRSVRDPDGGRGSVRAHVTVEQQETWVRDRAKGWGFDVEAVSVTGRRHASFGRHTDGASDQVTVATATYDGVLAVTDADLLRAAMTSGVGRAKAYGCGLITLAPLS